MESWVCWTALFTFYRYLFRWKITGNLQMRIHAFQPWNIPEYCLKSKADNTLKNANTPLFHFASGVLPLHLRSLLYLLQIPLVTYLIYLSEKLNSAATFYETLYSIHWTHSLGVCQNLCEPFLVKSVKERIIRSVSQAMKKKEPISPEVLASLVRKLGKEIDSLQDMRFCYTCLMAYAGFLRFSELTNLKRIYCLLLVN
jgi:hypothetical protein